MSLGICIDASTGSRRTPSTSRPHWKLQATRPRNGCALGCSRAILDTYLDSGGAVLVGVVGSGWRAEADRITGLWFYLSSGTGTGKFTLFASV